jgi:hypothetical protein
VPGAIFQACRVACGSDSTDTGAACLSGWISQHKYGPKCPDNLEFYVATLLLKIIPNCQLTAIPKNKSEKV